jgi:hypothetical protein
MLNVETLSLRGKANNSNRGTTRKPGSLSVQVKDILYKTKQGTLYY